MAARRRRHDVPCPQNTTIHLCLTVYCRLFYDSPHFSIVSTTGLIVAPELNGKTGEIGSQTPLSLRHTSTSVVTETRSPTVVVACIVYIQ